MADYPNTASILDSATVEGPTGTAAKTRTSLSTQVIVYVNDEPVGAIQTFAANQSRGVKQITEVGTDGIIEIIPNSATKVGLTCNRIMFDGLSLTESMSRGFVNIQSQRIPFDIVVIDKFSGGGSEDSIVTTYHNCWFTSLKKSYTTTDYVVAEDCGMDAEYVTSYRGGKDTPVANGQGTGGGREVANRQIDNIEQAADVGLDGRRGSLDFPGLISAAY